MSKSMAKEASSFINVGCLQNDKWTTYTSVLHPTEPAEYKGYYTSEIYCKVRDTAAAPNLLIYSGWAIGFSSVNKVADSYLTVI